VQATAATNVRKIGSGDNPARLPELDGVRGLALLMVIVWHYFSSQVGSEPGSLLSILIGAARFTWSGVDLFFVLSGFLIGSILLENVGQPNALQTFYVRRACRILPLYVVSVALFLTARQLLPAAFGWLFKGSIPDASYLTLTQDFAMGRAGEFGPGWLDITWSLAVEEQFYLLLPILLIVLPLRTGLCAVVALITAAPVLRYAFGGGIAAYVLPFCRADSLLLGVMCAVLVRHPLWRERQADFRRWLGVALVALAIGAAVLMKWRLAQMGGSLTHTYWALLYATFLLYVLTHVGHITTAPLRSDFMSWVGTRSYAIYLFHQPVSGLMHGLLGTGEPRITSLESALVTLSCIALSFALAEVSFRWLETPFLELGKRYSYSRGRLAGVVAR
jgi:peptidoglycan/LPS O-acetylase OafA/YrhL